MYGNNVMNCDAYRILITGYIDEELNEREMHTLKAHLAECDHCLQYLQRQETMQAALKRYSLLHEPPQVPEYFASKVTEQLQELVQETEPASFWESFKKRGQNMVLQFVERWVSSLKTRPYAWIGAMSCFVMLFAGLLSFQMYQHTYQQAFSLLTTEVSEHVSPLRQPEPFSASIDDTDSPIMIVTQTDGGLERYQDSPVLFEETEGEADASGKMPDVIYVGEEGEASFIQVAHNGANSVEDYVYSHVVEGYQDRIVDDAVFVGYVQDVFIQ